MVVGIPGVWFHRLSALTFYAGVNKRGEFAAIPMATLKLAARIHNDVAAAAWREYKKTHLYNFLMTDIFFRTGMLLFIYCDSPPPPPPKKNKPNTKKQRKTLKKKK